MSSGRRALPSEIGYAFIFFYGLERRALVDEADHALVLKEVFRLNRLNNARAEGYNRSFDLYTSSFLWYMVTSFPRRVPERSLQTLMKSMRLWDEDALSAALGWFVSNNRPLAPWAAYVVAGQLHESRRSVVTQRVGGEFQRLFEARLTEQFPQGLLVRSSKRERLHSYRPASGVLSTNSRSCPNPLGLRSQFKALSAIWNACIEDLRRLSSVVGKEGAEVLSPTAWEAMPPEVRAGVEHPLTDAICRLVDECTDDQGRTLMPASRLAAVAGFEAPTRLTLAQSRKICEAAEHVGYGIVPDARLTGRAYRADETVGAFLRTMEERADPQRWNAAACMLRLGFGIAGADGQVDPDEVGVVTRTIEQVFALNAEEQRRLKVLRDILLVEGTSLKGLSRLTKSLTSEQQQAIARVLLLVIAHDGVVTTQETRAFRRCCTSLGFSHDEIDRSLQTIERYRTDMPVTIQAGIAAAPGEAIPSPAGVVTEVRLDRDAIAAIMRDTEEVAQMLAQAMLGEADEEQVEERPRPSLAQPLMAGPSAKTVAASPAPEGRQPRDGAEPQAEPVTVTASDTALPQQYVALYRMLVTRDRWDRAEIDARAREQGLMLSGAIDALNEWAYEKYGGQLFVEDGENLLVEREYLD
jgi:uncharacterized tellurite resistance protein B-like protein